VPTPPTYLSKKLHYVSRNWVWVVWNGSINIVRLGSIPKSASGQVVFVLLSLVALLGAS
jgi:hypothetical protein